MAETKVINKLSIASIKANPRKVAALEEGQALRIATIFGMASGIKLVEDKTSGSHHQALTGNFEAINVETGDIFQSGILYLPKGIHETVVAAVEKLTDESESVKFALDIRAVQAKNPIGYSYEAVALVKPEGVDPLDELRKALPQSAPPVKQLDAATGKTNNTTAPAPAK